MGAGVAREVLSGGRDSAAAPGAVLFLSNVRTQCFAKCPFTCQFDRLSDQLCQSLDRLSDHLAKHCADAAMSCVFP